MGTIEEYRRWLDEVDADSNDARGDLRMLLFDAAGEEWLEHNPTSGIPERRARDLLVELDAAKAENDQLRRRNKILHQKARLWLNRVNECCEDYDWFEATIARQRHTIKRLVDVRMNELLAELDLTWGDAIEEGAENETV